VLEKDICPKYNNNNNNNGTASEDGWTYPNPTSTQFQYSFLRSSPIHGEFDHDAKPDEGNRHRSLEDVS
jgi:hypothetical protein